MTRVAIILPCHNESVALPTLFDQLLPQLEAAPTWELIAVDDASTDTTLEILTSRLAGLTNATVLSGSWRSPGDARTVAANAATVLRPSSAVEWLVTIDADIDIDRDWIKQWSATFTDATSTIGSFSGGAVEDVGAGFPNASKVGAVYGAMVNWSEQRVGVVNITGSNHAIRTEAYLTAGPYVQPRLLTSSGSAILAGEDWDLGVRARQAGYTIEAGGPLVRSLGRRFRHNVRAYLDGSAYEGVFAPVEADEAAQDIGSDEVAGYAEATLMRVLRHYYFKALLAVPELIEDQSDLDAPLRRAMADHVLQWRSPTFSEDRNGFIYGRLGRFAEAFSEPVIEQCSLRQMLSTSVDS